MNYACLILALLTLFLFNVILHRANLWTWLHN